MLIIDNNFEICAPASNFSSEIEDCIQKIFSATLVILMAFKWVNFYFYFKNRNKSHYLHMFCLYKCVAVLFCSYLLSNTFYAVLLQSHFCKTWRTLRVKHFWIRPCLCKKMYFSTSANRRRFQSVEPEKNDEKVPVHFWEIMHTFEN